MKVLNTQSDRFWNEYEECFNSYTHDFPDANCFIEQEFLPRGHQLLDLFKQADVNGTHHGALGDSLLGQLDYEWCYDEPLGRSFCLVAYRYEMFVNISQWLPRILQFLSKPPQYQIIFSTDFPLNSPTLAANTADDFYMIIRPDEISVFPAKQLGNQAKILVDFTIDELDEHKLNLFDVLFGSLMPLNRHSDSAAK